MQMIKDLEVQVSYFWIKKMLIAQKIQIIISKLLLLLL